MLFLIVFLFDSCFAFSLFLFVVVFVRRLFVFFCIITHACFFVFYSFFFVLIARWPPISPLFLFSSLFWYVSSLDRSSLLSLLSVFIFLFLLLYFSFVVLFFYLWVIRCFPWFYFFFFKMFCQAVALFGMLTRVSFLIFFWSCRVYSFICCMAFWYWFVLLFVLVFFFCICVFFFFFLFFQRHPNYTHFPSSPIFRSYRLATQDY